MIKIVFNSLFYETDYEAISYDALLKLQQMYHQNSVLAEAYVYDALRCADDLEQLFEEHLFSRYKTIREYGERGLSSLEVYDDSRLVEKHTEDVKNILIDDYGEVIFDKLLHHNGKRYILGCRVFYDRTSFQARLYTDSFELEKFKFLYSEGFNEKEFGGRISIDADYIVYDDDCYETKIVGVSDITTRRRSVRYMGIVLDNEGRIVFSSIDDTFGNLLNTMVGLQ